MFKLHFSHTYRVLLLVFLCLFSSFTLHKYYMSITQINFVEKQHAVQIISRVFIDDLETELNATSSQKIELATNHETKNIDSIYEHYLKEKLNFTINNKASNFNFIGKEYHNNMVVFYLEIPNINNIANFTIQNSLLTTNFQEQENIVKTTIYNKNNSLILTANNPRKSITF